MVRRHAGPVPEALKLKFINSASSECPGRGQPPPRALGRRCWGRPGLSVIQVKLIFTLTWVAIPNGRGLPAFFTAYGLAGRQCSKFGMCQTDCAVLRRHAGTVPEAWPPPWPEAT